MSRWTDFFIQRPVFSISLALLIIFAGLFSLLQLPLQLLPTIEVPTITVSTAYPGASSDTMQNFVTNVLQNALAGIKGINDMTSTSAQNSSVITINMQTGVDTNAALTDIAQKVNSVRGQLPQGIYEPVISKTDPSDNFVMLLSFTSHEMSRPQISDYLMRMVKPQLESVDGVASAPVWGNLYAMHIDLNPIALSARNLSPTDVTNALSSQNVQGSPGTLEGVGANLNLSTNSDISSAEQFNQLIIKKSDNGATVHLQDVGNANLGVDTDKVTAFYNGEPASMSVVMPQPGANPLTIVKHIQKLLPMLTQQFPEDLHLHEVVNVATFIKASVQEVIKTLVEALLIVSVVIFLFLGSPRAVLIPLVTIPISLIGICFFLYTLGFSINVLTLLAMVISIGLVVDDAIVVMENIFRHLERGGTAMNAAILGTREIAFSVIAMTITLAAIFAPIAFSTGITGKLFSEFAFSLAGSVIISGIAALTLSPMMCSRIINQEYSHQPFVQKIEKIFESVRRQYETLLHKALQHRRWILGIWGVSLLACVYFYTTTQKELAPQEDMGFLQVFGSAPNSASTSLLASYSQELNKIYQGFSEVKSYIYVNGIPAANQVISFVSLKPWGERNVTSGELQPQLQAQLNQVAGLKLVAIVPPVLPGASGMPVQFVIKSIGDYKSLYDAAQTLETVAKQSGLFLFINDDLSYDQPVLQLDIDRDAASATNVNIDQITQALSSLYSQGHFQYFNMQGQTYEVIPEALSAYHANPDLLNSISVRANTGTLIPLSALVTMHTKVEPSSLNQFQKFNAVMLSGVMTPGHSISEGLNFLQEKAQTLLPKAMSYDYGGTSRQFIQEGDRMLWLFLASFIAIFIILSMQFESFRDPLIILLGSVPMALMAALLPMKLGFATINIYTQIGLLTLAGLISKHGILLVKFANSQRLEGKPKVESIVDSAKIRLRPILMTTLATVFGSIPLILSTGAGRVSRFDIGIVIVCGMLLGTCFTLFVLPTLYYYFSGNVINIPPEN